MECKGLLIGEGASGAVVSGVKNIVEAHPGILAVNELLTMHLGPEDILLNISIDFSDELTSGGVERAISDLERQIKETFPAIKRVFDRSPERHRPPIGPRRLGQGRLRRPHRLRGRPAEVI